MTDQKTKIQITTSKLGILFTSGIFLVDGFLLCHTHYLSK